jgi:hypothetical protein
MVERRDFLRKAAVAGTGAFVVPTIVTVAPADAQALTSPPPNPPGSKRLESPGTDLASSPRTQSRTKVPGRTELPRTGTDINRLAAAGLAATAGGAALVIWSADVRSRSKSGSYKPASKEPAS